jgi:Protein of unknown function (DUF3089)
VLPALLLALMLALPVRAAEPSFAEQVPPPVPRYDEEASWALRGAGQPASGVDLFFVHPTTFRSARFNQAVEDAAANAVTDREVIGPQALLFADCCRLFAPRYRQASSRAFAEMGGDGDRAYDLAYGDVLRAFDWYLAHENGGRPFLLAGHSQGALHVLRLLQERVAGRALAARLVAAYAVGIGIPLPVFGRELPGLVPCSGPARTRCVLSWNSYAEGSDATGFVARSEQRFAAADRGHGLLCQALSPRGRCAGGVFVVRDLPAGITPLPGGSLHLHDMALVAVELRQDAMQRAESFRSREPNDGR